MGIGVRSNVGYAIRASRTGTLPSAAANTGTLSAGDVGVGVFGVSGTGNSALIVGTAVADTITGTTSDGYYYGLDASFATPFSASNGQAVWTKSLNDITTTTTQMISGTRVSNGGDNTSSNNRLSMTLAFSIKPQYYAHDNVSPTKQAILSFDIVAVP